MADNREVLLRVENLCQYFGPTKAVDNVSFDIYKGEVFGLVGESGCGKTTTGRSIIKIYDITSGNIYFKGQRICAGMTLAIEPMISQGDWHTDEGDDGWAVLTRDGNLSAHYEHTIAVTADGLPEILTLPGHHWAEDTHGADSL